MKNPAVKLPWQQDSIYACAHFNIISVFKVCKQHNPLRVAIIVQEASW